MPTTRTRKKRILAPTIDPVRLKMMNDEPVQDSFLTLTPITKREWNENKKTVVSDWIKKFPGTRPSTWWDFEAPEIRQRIGGIGDCENDVFNIVPVVTLGIPEDWIGLAWLEVYPDLTAIDPENPPVFESQATYLKRHKILTKAEKNSLKLMDFETERIKIDENINIV